MKNIAVIIVTYNNKADIESCLKTVKKQSIEEDYHIIVVDNGSTDGTIQQVNKFSDVYLIDTGKNTGYAGGNNIGLKYALNKEVEYCVILNPDTEVDIDWLKNLIKVAKDRTDSGLIQSKILFAGEKFRVNSVGNPLHYLGFSWSGGYKDLSSKHQEIKTITAASGASVLIKSTVLKQVGLFDDKLFMYHEDLDMSWRARLAGFNIYISPNSKVYHKYSFSFGTKKFFYFERNRWILFFSNYRIFTIILFLPIFIVTDLLMLVYSIFTGWLKFKIQSYLGIVILIPHIIKRRNNIKKIRIKKDRDILKLMTKELYFEDLNNPLLKYLYNPFAKVYYAFIIFFIRW